MHRPARALGGGRALMARLAEGYLWGGAELGALPPTVELRVWDQEAGLLHGERLESHSIPPAAVRSMGRAATGEFTWHRSDGDHLASYWAFPTTRRFVLPGWRVILTESEDDIAAPAASFARTFPLVLALSIAVVLVLGASQIKRSLVPLDALRDGTRRIAARQFETRVRIRSGDEIEELAGAFNAMAEQLGRQFKALSAAAEIDRAVLSAMDTASIVQTVLARLPQVTEAERIAVVLLDPPGGGPTAWLTGDRGHTRREPVSVTVSEETVGRFLTGADHLVLESEADYPPFLNPLKGGPDGPVDLFPLSYGNQTLGALAVRRLSGQLPADEERGHLRRLADQVAVALTNARMVEQVRFMAFYDSLTRLPNRVLHKQRLGEALARARRLRRLVGVCFLDLDHFSRINDTMGHDLGDRLVQDVAARLVASCREGDSIARIGADGGAEGGIDVARLGGDEFTVLLPDIADPQDAARVAERILETFDRPFRLGTQEVFVSASVGIAVYPYDGEDADDLLKHADVAMYHAKEQGRASYRMFSAAMNAEAVARMRLEQQLRRAVDRDDFAVWFQPILDLDTGEVTSAEALVRWSHPERGLVSPAEFMRISEESGLIVPLGGWILRTVCRQIRVWEDEGLGPLRVAVNLSARQLRDPGFVALVRNSLAESGLEASSLVLELTESMLMDPGSELAATLRALDELGVGLAIDDFGTGYSSLSYLKHFPVRTLKVDQSFIRDVTENQDDAAITRAIIALARALNVTVVAEGVETLDQASFLKRAGCDMVQGFLIGRPEDVSAFSVTLRQWRARTRQLTIA
ncbi:MAG: putative bifunctional diguanylate cyclase/phosphodiesterase [Gemmatimonadales bacterium]